MLVQERRYSSVLAVELRRLSTDPSKCPARFNDIDGNHLSGFQQRVIKNIVIRTFTIFESDKNSHSIIQHSKDYINTNTRNN